MFLQEPQSRPEREAFRDYDLYFPLLEQVHSAGPEHHQDSHNRHDDGQHRREMAVEVAEGGPTQQGRTWQQPTQSFHSWRSVTEFQRHDAADDKRNPDKARDACRIVIEHDADQERACGSDPGPDCIGSADRDILLSEPQKEAARCHKSDRD